MSTNDLLGSQQSTTIAIAATFTAEPLEPSLRFWMQELSISSRIEFAPYNQVFQQILDPKSLLSTNSYGINIILIRPEDWNGRANGAAPQSSTIDLQHEIERNMEDFLSTLRTATERTPASFVVCLCPPSPSQMSDPELADFFKLMEERVIFEVASIPAVHILTNAELRDYYPVIKYYDDEANNLAHMPYTPVLFSALGTMLARKIYSLKSPPYKVIALDCDQTLWTGICGEVGPDGIQIDSVCNVLQEFIVQRYQAGMLICLCSKNNEEDVTAVFDCHPDMPLKWDHILSWRINWKPKSENLESLARELNLGLDSFIFIDNDPLECAEVEARCPEVLVLQLPRDRNIIPNFLKHLWVFDRLKTTAEDRRRTILYQQEAARESSRESSPTFSDFLAGLNMKIDFSPIAANDMARAADLTVRTNQFNTTTIRRQEAELQRFCHSTNGEGLVVHVQDRFGDYGLVGLILFRTSDNAIDVDTFLLSCRAMGRGVDHRMLTKLGEIALERGVESIEIPVLITQKNRPALEFLDSIEGGAKISSSNGLRYRFSAKIAAEHQYPTSLMQSRNEELAEIPPPTGGVPQSTLDARAKVALMASIALELYDPAEIHSVISAKNHFRAESISPSERPETPMEKQVAALWSELLGLKAVGKNDDFFSLGGHSLLAMQILSRLRDTFNVELSPRLLYTAEFTVAGLSKVVLSEQVRQADPGTVNAILKELEALSDNEIKTLLNANENPKRD